MRLVFQFIILMGLFSVSALSVQAQQERDREKEKKERENAINTRKKTPVKFIEYIVGTWEVQGIYKDRKDISQADSAGMGETIEFDREGRYVSHSGAMKIDSGAYRLNENHGILYLESEAGEATTEWNVSFSGDGMMLQRRGSYPHAESFRYVYTRISRGNKSN